MRSGRKRIWLLGSSLYSAQLAAEPGLPFAFASHFAPADLMPALALCRSRFEPSEALARPYAMLSVNVIAADTDREAARLFTSLQQSFVNLRRGRPGRLPPPIEDLGSFASPAEHAQLRQALACSFVGTPDMAREGLAAYIAQTAADELIVSGHIFDRAARLRSFAIAAGVRDALAHDARRGAQGRALTPDTKTGEVKEGGGED